jgi:ribosomal protein S18 acetylase RimI-like enzyme
MDDLTIRAATRDDEATLLNLATRLTEFELPPWRTAREIADADGRAMMSAVRHPSSDDEVFIAERNGAVVGCLHMQAPTDFFGRPHAHISVIASTRESEGSGVGRALMAHAEVWARERGLTLMTLNVFATNARARRFYEIAGYTAETMRYVKLL